MSLGVNMESGFQEDFWKAQKIGHMSCLVDCTGHALGQEQGLTRNACAEHLAESSEKLCFFPFFFF